MEGCGGEDCQRDKFGAVSVSEGRTEWEDKICKCITYTNDSEADVSPWKGGNNAACKICGNKVLKVADLNTHIAVSACLVKYQNMIIISILIKEILAK